MGRAPCCDKNNVKRGPWSPEEDAKLKAYIEQYGTGGNWIALPQKIGLKRCGKSCRLRWLNYLRPNIKHGGFSEEEDNIICSLYISIGSRWSIIAAQLPGRTDNDVKNYWNTRLKKKLLGRARKQSNTNNNNNLSSNEGLSSSALERLQLHLQLQNPNSSSSIHHSLIQSSFSTALNNPHLMQQLASANLVNNNGQTNYLHILQQQIFQAPAVINPNYDHGLVSPNYSSTTTANTTEILVDPTAPNGHFNDQDAPAAASLLMTPIYSNKSAAAAAASGNDLCDHEFDCFKQVISTDIVDDIVDNINGTTSSKENQEQEQEEESFMWWSNNSSNMDQFFQPRSSAAASASASNSRDQGTGMFQDYAGHHELGANIYICKNYD